MMVEDDPDDRRIYGSILTYNGFNVLQVPDGSTALDVVKVYRPDLILLDLGLPDVSGLDICRSLSGGEEGKAVPVVALTTFPETEMGGRARAAGCVAYLEKPTGPVNVLHKIEELLGPPPRPGEGPMPRVISYPSTAPDELDR